MPYQTPFEWSPLFPPEWQFWGWEYIQWSCCARGFLQKSHLRHQREGKRLIWAQGNLKQLIPAKISITTQMTKFADSLKGLLIMPNNSKQCFVCQKKSASFPAPSSVIMTIKHRHANVTMKTQHSEQRRKWVHKFTNACSFWTCTHSYKCQHNKYVLLIKCFKQHLSMCNHMHPPMCHGIMKYDTYRNTKGWPLDLMTS